jgi:hypothetical protein
VADRNLGRPLLYCAAGLLLALLLALAAARGYQAPNQGGASTVSLWREADFLYSVASSGVALFVAWVAGRQIPGPSDFVRALARSAAWFALTVLLYALWAPYVFLLTLLLAPSHAFAALRLWRLWRAFRDDVAWRR